MKIEVINENLTSYRIAKDYEIEIIPEEGEESIILEFNKYVYEDDNNVDNDYNFTPESKEIYDKLTDDQKDEVDTFISNLSVSQKIVA